MLRPGPFVLVLLAGGLLACTSGEKERHTGSNRAEENEAPATIPPTNPAPTTTDPATADPATADPVTSNSGASTPDAGDRPEDAFSDASSEASLDASASEVEDTERADAQAGDAETSDAGLLLESVRIIRGSSDDNFVSLTVYSEGLTEYEGMDVHVRLGTPERPPERLATGYARIVDGAFSLTFPESNEWGLYKQRLVFIDVDADGTCSEADRLYGDWRFLLEDAALVLSDSIPPHSVDSIAPTMGQCSVFNQPWPEE